MTTSDPGSLKQLIWVGSSRRDLKRFPAEVRHGFGFALYLAQVGDRAISAKPLKGFNSVVELVERYDCDTYRAMYTVRFNNAVYVLHAFQKKSKRGAKTPQRDLDLVRQRLRAAETLQVAYGNRESET